MLLYITQNSDAVGRDEWQNPAEKKNSNKSFHILIPTGFANNKKCWGLADTTNQDLLSLKNRKKILTSEKQEQSTKKPHQ